MPHANVWEWHGIVMTFWGTVSGKQFLQAAQSVAADAALDDLRFAIIDFTDVIDHTIDESTQEDLAALRIGSIATNPNVRVVFVTPNEKMAALGRAMNRWPLTGSHEVHVFATVELAREWLHQQPVLSAFRRPE